MQSRFLLKVSKFPKQFMVSWTLPKNEQKQFDLRYHSSKVECFPLFLGRIQETINCFRNILTCKETNSHFSISNSQSHFTIILTWFSNNQVCIGFKVQHYCKPKYKFFLTYTVLCIQVPQKHLQFQVTIPSAMSDATFLPLNSIVLLRPLTQGLWQYHPK